MAWYNPTTWFKPSASKATVVTSTPVPAQVVSTKVTDFKSGESVKTNTNSAGTTKTYSSSPSGGHSSSPSVGQSQAIAMSTPTDASFTSGGSSSGTGGVTYNPATNASIQSAPKNTIGLPTTERIQTDAMLLGFGSQSTGMVRHGTLMTNGMGQQQTPFITYGDMQNNIQNSREFEGLKAKNTFYSNAGLLQTDIQNKINSGDINVTQGTALFDTQIKPYQEDYSKTYNNIQQQYPDVNIPTKTSAKDLGISAIKFGASLTPIGAFTLMGAEGAKAEILVDKNGELPTYPNYRVSDSEFAYGVAGLGGAVSTPFKAGADITKLRIFEGLNGKPSVVTREISPTTQVQTSSYTNPTFSSFTKSTISNINPIDETTVAFTGTGKTTTHYSDFMTQIQQGYGKSWVGKTNSFSFAGKSQAIDLYPQTATISTETGLMTPAGLKGTYTSGYISSQAGVKDFSNLAISRTAPSGKSIFIGGDATKLIVKPNYAGAKTIVNLDSGTTSMGKVPITYTTRANIKYGGVFKPSDLGLGTSGEVSGGISGGERGFTSFQGGQATKIFIIDMQSSKAFATPKIFAPTGTSTVQIGKTGLQSIQTKAISSTVASSTGKQTLVSPTIQLETPASKSFQIVSPVLAGATATTPRTRSGSSYSFAPASSEAFKPAQTQSFVPALATGTETKLTQRYGTPNVFVNLSSIGSPFAGSGGGLAGGFAFPSLGFDEGMFKTRGFQGKRSYKYTPSYEALKGTWTSKGIFGKAPKSASGLALGTRPITAGFSFFGNAKNNITKLFKRRKK